jgi:rifampin ADP-ribosylating transferase
MQAMASGAVGAVTASYRSLESRRVIGEVEDWVGHPPEPLQEIRDDLARLQAEGRDEMSE